MATVSSTAQTVEVSSKITVTWEDRQGDYYYTRSSNTGTGSVTCSVSVPNGSTINSSTFSCTTTGGTLYGGTTKINGTTVSGTGPHYVGNGTAVSITVSFSFKSTASSSYNGNPTSTYTQTRTFANCILTVDYTPPTAPSVWGVTLDASTGTQYRGSNAGLTLNWSAQNGASNNNITSYSVHASDNGGAWYWWGSLSPGSTVTAHPTQGNSRKWLITPVAPYGNGAGVESPTVYTYSYPTAPAISISPSSCYTGDATTISFSGASGGTGVSISSYSLYPGNSDSALVNGITGSSYAMTAPATAGTYTYRMRSIGSVSGYNSGYSNTVTLVVSPRQSSFTVNNASYPNLGQLLTATISPVNSSYTHKIKWQATNNPSNYNSGGYATISAGVTTATFTPPLSWAKAEPSSPNTIGITVLLQTWNGASQVGTDAVVSFSSNIPASVKPQNPSSSGATFTPNPALPAFGGVFLVGNSKLQSTLSYSNNSYTNATSYTFIITPPAPQSQYSSTVSTPTYTTANTLSMAGTYTISAYATDARGRSSDTVAVGSIIVYGYNQPSFNITYLSREPVTSGTQFGITATVTVDKRNPPLSANAVSATHVFRAEWREKGATTWNTANIVSGTPISLGSPDIALNKAYEVRVSAGDKVYETRVYSQTYTIPPVVRQFDFKNDRASLGKIASDTAKTFTLPDDWTTNINADLLDGNHASAFAAASHGHSSFTRPVGTNVSPDSQSLMLNGSVSNNSDIVNAPGLGFHIPGINWMTLKMASDSSLRAYNSALNGYVPFFASAFYEDGVAISAKYAPLLSYPVGAIYMSTSSTSPATLFGGTWSALPTGRFLRVGTGGATGGSDTHVHSTTAVALTVAQMASHYHDQRASGYNYLDKMTTRLGNGGGGSEAGNQVPAGSYATGGIGLGTTSTGSGATHGHGNTGSASNVPAYYEVYAWRRTA